jgi:hypothetical protein
MNSCNLNSSSEKTICVKLGFNLNVEKNKIILEQNLKGQTENILKKHTGNSKKNIYEFKYKNKNYISYIEDYIIPKNKNSKFISLSELNLYKFEGKDKKNIKALFKELSYHYEIEKYYPGLTPKIVSITLFSYKGKVRCQVISDSAYNKGYYMIGDIIDNKRLNLEMGNIRVKNQRDEILFNYMKRLGNTNKNIKGLNFDFYSRMFNPLFIKKNLEKWYKKVSFFFDPFFKELNKLHRINIFHHDLHMKNIWMNNFFQFRFIDFGRSAGIDETLNISFPNKNYKNKLFLLQQKEKNKIKKKIYSKNVSKKEILFCLMMTELNYPDTLKYQNINQDCELARHDIDEAILINCFGKDYDIKQAFRLKTEKEVEEIQKIQSYYYTEVLLTYKYFVANKYVEANLS